MLMLAKAVVSVLQRWDIEAQESLIGAGFPEMRYANCQFVFAQRPNSAVASRYDRS
jgi:hypothetical protein